MKFRLLATTLLMATLTGCSNDNGIEVTGYLDGGQIEITAKEQFNDTTEVLLTVVGRPGAAANFGQVIANNTRVDNSPYFADVSTTGSFVLDVPVLLNDTVRLQHSDGVAADTVDVVADTLQDFPQVQSVFAGPPENGRSPIEIELSATLPSGYIVVFNYDNDHAAELHEFEQNPIYHVGSLPAQTGHHAAAFWVRGDGDHSLGHEFVIP